MIKLRIEMATILSPNPAMQDIKVTYKESTLVYHSQHTAKTSSSLFLSNIDQFLNINVPTLLFYPANPDFSPEIVTKRLKMALQKVLVMYEFMGGRLKWDPQSGRLEIDCNGAGAGFVVASSELSVDEMGDLACPNLGFRQLAVQSLDNTTDDDQPLCILQVTSFKCGGFAIGMSLNHILFDGIAAKAFLENLASQTFDNKSPPFIPCHNRRLLAARSPPRISFPHTEFFKPDRSLPDLLNTQQLNSKILKLSSNDITFLKAKADNTRIATTFTVVAALIWRCIAFSDNNKDKVSTLLNAVDLRSRINNPPLPSEYCGNAILFARASAKGGEMEKWGFSNAVEMVAEGIARVTDEYARSSIDWLEINKGIPFGDIIVTSWLRLGFDEAAFPWGKAACFTPVVNNLKSLCWVFSGGGGGGGVNVLVQRPAEEMEKFESQFVSFFHNN